MVQTSKASQKRQPRPRQLSPSHKLHSETGLLICIRGSRLQAGSMMHIIQEAMHVCKGRLDQKRPTLCMCSMQRQIATAEAPAPLNAYMAATHCMQSICPPDAATASHQALSYTLLRPQHQQPSSPLAHAGPQGWAEPPSQSALCPWPASTLAVLKRSVRWVQEMTEHGQQPVQGRGLQLREGLRLGRAPYARQGPFRAAHNSQQAVELVRHAQQVGAVIAAIEGQPWQCNNWPHSASCGASEACPTGEGQTTC